MIFVSFKLYQKFIFLIDKRYFRKCFHKKLWTASFQSEGNSTLIPKLLSNNLKPDKESKRLCFNLEYNQHLGRKWLRLPLLLILLVKLLNKVRKDALPSELTWMPSQWYKPILNLNTSPKTMELPTCAVTMVIWPAYLLSSQFSWVNLPKSPKTKLSDCFSSHHKRALIPALNLWSKKAASMELMKFTDVINGQQLHWVKSGANKGLSWVRSQLSRSKLLEPVDMEVNLKS